MIVSVIGSGVVGLACASYLQMQGHTVSVIDPTPPGEACSLGNAGCFSRASCVPLGLPGMWRKVPGWLMDPAGPLSIPVRYAPRIAPWILQLRQASSLQRVNQIADALHPLLTCTLVKWKPLAERAGVPELLVQNGYAFAYESDEGFLADKLGRDLRLDRGVKIEVLLGHEVREFDPALSPRITHLVVLPEQGHCPNPLRLSRALAARLLAGGARFVQQRVTSFKLSDSRITQVLTEGGDAVQAEAVVIAAGAHSTQLTRMLGTNVPLETERGYHVMLERPTIAPRIPVASGEGKYFLTPMEGGLRIAGTVELAGLDAPADFKRADGLMVGKRLLPGLDHGGVVRWMGHRPSLPDSKPVIGRSTKIPNAFFAFGHGHVGLTAAAPTGEIIADLVAGRRPFMDIQAFSAERF